MPKITFREGEAAPKGLTTAPELISVPLGGNPASRKFQSNNEISFILNSAVKEDEMVQILESTKDFDICGGLNPGTVRVSTANSKA